MPRSRKPQRLGDVLEEVIEEMGIRRRLDQARVVEAWTAVAGPKIGGMTNSTWVKGATLYVKISSAAWRHELHLRRRAWRDRLNEELGQELIDEIVFR